MTRPGCGGVPGEVRGVEHLAVSVDEPALGPASVVAVKQNAAVRDPREPGTRPMHAGEAHLRHRQDGTAGGIRAHAMSIAAADARRNPPIGRSGDCGTKTKPRSRWTCSRRPWTRTKRLGTRRSQRCYATAA